MTRVAFLAFRYEPTHTFVLRDANAVAAPTLALASVRVDRALVGSLRWVRRSPKVVLSALTKMVVLHFRSPRRVLENLALFPLALAVADELHRRDIRHVHACWATHSATAARVCAQLLGGCYSFSIHAFDLTEEPSALAGKVDEATRIVACSAYARDRLCERVGAVGEKLAIVYHGLDLRRFEYRSRQPTHVLRVLFVGRIVPKKGVLTLIDAAHRLVRDGCALDVVIAGPEPDRAHAAQVRARARAGPAARSIRFRGWLDESELLGAFARASVFVHPAGRDPKQGDEDGIPNLLIEAMAAGVPVVAGDAGGIRELVEDGETGVLVPVDDELLLAAALRGVQADPVAAACRAERARVRIEKRHDVRISSRRLAAVLGSAARVTA